MARTELRAGASLDLLNASELSDALDRARAIENELLRGVKKFKLIPIAGTPSGSALSMGGDSSASQQTPEEGYIWALTHLVIEGLTASSTAPDVVNVKIGNRIVWQLNGNQFCQTWGRGQFLIFPGETLSYVSVGTFAATGTITAHGQAWNVPAELQAKLS